MTKGNGKKGNVSREKNGENSVSLQIISFIKSDGLVRNLSKLEPLYKRKEDQQVRNIRT